MTTRQERLNATQRAYEEWADKTTFDANDLASDADEASLLDTMVEQELIQPE